MFYYCLGVHLSQSVNLISGQGGAEGGKDGAKKKAKGAAGDSGGRAEVSC